MVLVGTNLGAGHPSARKRIAWAGTGLAAAVCLTIGGTAASSRSPGSASSPADPAVLERAARLPAHRRALLLAPRREHRALLRLAGRRPHAPAGPRRTARLAIVLVGGALAASLAAIFGVVAPASRQRGADDRIRRPREVVSALCAVPHAAGPRADKAYRARHDAGPRFDISPRGASRAPSPARPRESRCSPAEMDPRLLKRLEWRRLEELCAAYFVQAGFRGELVHERADGGAQICLLRRARARPRSSCTASRGTRTRSASRRCASCAGPWARRTAPIVLVTAGRFTPEAAAFAAKERIELIDGAALLEKLAALAPEKAAGLLKLVTKGDFLTPTCPRCFIKMTARRSTGQGRLFWGCRNYPRCKLTFTGTTLVTGSRSWACRRACAPGIAQRAHE